MDYQITAQDILINMPPTALIDTIEATWGLEENDQTTAVILACVNALICLQGHEEARGMLEDCMGTAAAVELFELI